MHGVTCVACLVHVNCFVFVSMFTLFNVFKFLFLVVKCYLVEGECGCFEHFQLLLLTLGFQACKQRGFCDMSYWMLFLVYMSWII
jgi:hypothetical protein